jgi:hypothetical protein
VSRRTRLAVHRMRAQRFPASAPLPAARPRRHLALLTALAVVAAVVGITQAVHRPEYAQTAVTLHYTPAPQETPVQELTHLADLAATQPPPPGTGPYNYVRTKSWNLSTDMNTRMEILAAHIAVTDREQWAATDGSGRLAITVDGKPSSLTGNYAPGTMLGNFVTSLTDLKHRNPRATTAGAWIQLIKATWSDQTVTPALQAGLLRTLAGRPGLTLTGTTTDRAGRPGIAVSAQTPGLRRTLILSPDTGMLLDYEEVTLAAGALPIRTPATTGYTLWLATGYRATPGG